MKNLLLSALFLVASPPLFGAMVQFINNVPNEKLDIYINDQIQLPDIPFRQGTAFFSLPPGEWSLKVASANSESAEDALNNFTISLADSTNYVFMIGGELADVKLFTRQQHRFNSDAEQHIGISFIHATPLVDSITISLAEQFIWKGIKFGEYTPYFNIPSAPFAIVIEDAKQQEAIISNWVNLGFWQQKSAVIFTSGYADGRSPTLKTYVILSNGISFPLEEIPLPETHRKVQVQFIQNTPHQKFDLYLNDELLIDDFSAHESTSFLDLPKGEYFSIGLASAQSSSSFDIQNYFNFKFEEDLGYVIFLHEDEARTLVFPRIKNQVPQDVFPSSVATAFSQSAFHLDALDLYIDGEKIYKNIDQWEISAYYLLPSRPFRLDIKTAGMDDHLASYQVDLSAWRGNSAMLYTSTDTSVLPHAMNLHVALSDTSFQLSPLQNTNGLEGRTQAQEAAWMKARVDQKNIYIHYLNHSDEVSKFIVVDNKGQQVLEQLKVTPIATEQYIRLDVSHFNTGVYFLQATIDQKVFTKTIFLH